MRSQPLINKKTVIIDLGTIEEEPDVESLCCCEYINSEGELTHCLQLCCQCEELDNTFDRLLRGERMINGTSGRLCSILSDRIRIPWIMGGARKIDLPTLLPFILLPSLAYLATLGRLWTIFTFVSIPIILQILRKKVFLKKQASFYPSFTIANFIYGGLVLEFYIRTEDLQVADAFFSYLILVITLFFLWRTLLKSRRDPAVQGDKLPFYNFCRSCGYYIEKRDHHCVWLNCCIGKQNKNLFLLTLAFSAIWTAHLASLSFSTECYPGISVFGYLVFPWNCPEIYSTFETTVCFVFGCYCTLVMFLLLAIFVHQLKSNTSGVTYLEKKYAAAVAASGTGVGGAAQRTHSNNAISTHDVNQD